MEVKHIQPGVISYSAAISACAKAGKHKLAMELLREMEGKHVKPNVFSYSAAISACEKAGKHELAIELLREMETNDIQPDVISYSAVLEGIFVLKDYRGAFEIVEKAHAAECLPQFIMGHPKWDLHDLTLAVSCLLLTYSLLKMEVSSKEFPSCITIVTGQGHNSGGWRAKIL
ncbi:MAG: hypothetical protein SGARI_003163 [Bacillariaceae sp.]